MNRALLSVVLVLLTLTLKGAADDGHCDVSACMKEVKWPNGTYGIYNPINTEVNISNNGFISQEAWLIVRFTGFYGREMIKLRGYGSGSNGVGSLTPDDPLKPGVPSGNVYSKITLELRYPVSLNPQATIYILSISRIWKSLVFA